MTIEDDRDDNIYNQGFDYQGENVEPEYGPTTFAEFIQFHHEIRDWATHIYLQNYLVDRMCVGDMP